MKRLVLLGGLLYVLLLTGLATLNGPLLALTIPIVVCLAAALVYGLDKPQLKLSRTMSADRVSQDTPVWIQLTVTNVGAALEEVLIEDIVPPPLQVVEGHSRLLTSLPAGATVELEYTVSAQRGNFEFQTTQITTSDHLGLFQRQVMLEASARLLILPEPLKLRRMAIRPRRTRAYAGPVPARQSGSGVEFFGVREYQTGDPLRWINWKLSARHPRSLFTNEFEQERIADVGLILDARRRTDIELRCESLFQYSIRATASLAEVFLNDGNRVGLLIYGEVLNWTFPGYGKLQRERILRALAQASTGESQVFESLDYLPARFFPAQSQLVVVSPLCVDDLPMLVRLRARGYEVLLVSPDPIALEIQMLGANPTVSLAARIARLERTTLLRKLRRAGIQTVDWQIGQPFDQAIHTSLSRMARGQQVMAIES